MLEVIKSRGLPLDRITTTDVWATDTISANLPPMMEFKDRIDNLEWCTREYNVNYGTAKERRAKKIRGVKHTEEHNKKISESMKQHFAKMDGDGNG